MDKKKTKRLSGYFIIDTGLKFKFDVEREDTDSRLVELYDNSEWNFEKGDSIFIDSSSMEMILSDRVIGYFIQEYED